MPILAFVFFIALCILAGAGSILNLAFPVGAFVVGSFLFFRHRAFYLGFTWWIWFLTALVRRLADYQSSYTEPSPILLAPYLVMGISLVTVGLHLPKAHRQGGVPFILALAGVFYGLLVGLLFKPRFDVLRGTLDWLTPVSFGFHLFVHWRDYPHYRQSLLRTCLWSILVMGLYGIVQYVALPDWDRLWLTNSEMEVAAGSADDFGGMRIWSTMQSGEPFAAVMSGSLLLLFACQSFLRFPASIAGYLSFLIAGVRAAWLGWLAGLFVLASSLKVNHQIRLLVTILAMVLCLVPLAMTEQFAGDLGERFATFSNLQDDPSAIARHRDFSRLIGPALSSVLGEGIERETMDNSILAMFFYLGWFGALPYLGGMLLLVFRLFQASQVNSALFVVACRAVVVSVLVRMPLNGAVLGASGAMLWGCLALGLAAQKWTALGSVVNTVDRPLVSSGLEK